MSRTGATGRTLATCLPLATLGCAEETLESWVAGRYNGMIAATPLSHSYPPGTLVSVDGGVTLVETVETCFGSTDGLMPQVGPATAVDANESIKVDVNAAFSSLEALVQSLAMELGEVAGDVVAELGGRFDFDAQMEVSFARGRMLALTRGQLETLAAAIEPRCEAYVRDGARIVTRALDVEELLYRQGSEVVFFVGYVAPSTGIDFNVMYSDVGDVGIRVEEPITLAIDTIDYNDLQQYRR